MDHHSEDNDTIFKEKSDKLKLWWKEEALPKLKESKAGKLIAKISTNKKEEAAVDSQEKAVEVEEETFEERTKRIAEQYKAKPEVEDDLEEEVIEEKKFVFFDLKTWKYFSFKKNTGDVDDVTETVTIENDVVVDESVHEDLSKEDVKELADQDINVDTPEIVEEVEEPKPIIPFRVIFNNARSIKDENSSPELVIAAFTTLYTHFDIEKDGKHADVVVPILEAATVRAAKLGHDKALEYLSELPNRDSIAPAIWIDTIQSKNIEDIDSDSAVTAFKTYTAYVKEKNNSKVTDQYIDVAVSQVNSVNVTIRNDAFNEMTGLLKDKKLNKPQTKKVMGMLKDTLANEKSVLRKDAVLTIVNTVKSGEFTSTYEKQYTAELEGVIETIKERLLLERLAGANKTIFDASLRQLAYNSFSGDKAKAAEVTFPQALDKMEMFVVKDNRTFIEGRSLESIIRKQPAVDAFLNKNELMKIKLEKKDREIADLFVTNKSDVSDDTLNKENQIVAENANDTFEKKTSADGIKPKKGLENGQT